VKLLKTEDYHEDMSCCLFVSFSRDENGEILGEPPDVYFSYGYLEDGFDEKIWTHFVVGDFNFLFHDADPLRFPHR
jgi:hypothetical protein